MTVKLHPIKNIPNPIDEKAANKVPDVKLMDVVVAYAVAVASMVFAGFITVLYGASLGFLLQFTPLGVWVLEALRELGVQAKQTSLVHLGSLLGFVSFCMGLMRVNRR